MAKLIASWRSINPEENRFRHYSLTLEKNLWGREVLVKRWGRIGHQKVVKYYRPKSYGDLVEEIRKVAALRREHGYRPASADSLLTQSKNNKKEHIDKNLLK